MTDPQDTSMGTISLIFGVLGCLGIGACWGSLIAIITGYMSKGTEGASNGRIGRFLGWIMLCLPIIGFIVYVILVFVLWGGSWIPIP
ncbi:MAG: hypothetical protein FK732_03900 [Asgard group archaeon]|nr:hypothetical protein [Asgard group archaeon]